jgi:hypothetical protein
MKDYQQRVIAEKEALDGKITRLSGFIGGFVFGTLVEPERARLKRQLEIMHQYSEVLEERIAAFRE